jgi:hypothetical protein
MLCRLRSAKQQYYGFSLSALERVDRSYTARSSMIACSLSTTTWLAFLASLAHRLTRTGTDSSGKVPPSNLKPMVHESGAAFAHSEPPAESSNGTTRRYAKGF